MGALTQGLGTAEQAAKGSLTAGLIGTGLSAVGDITSGYGSAQQFNYQAQIAQNNAAISRQNEDAGLVAGSYEESQAKLRTGQTVSAQRAAQASNGIDVNIGSPVDVRNSTATVGALDAAMIHYNAARAAYGAESSALNFEAQADADRRAASNAKRAGISKAAMTLAGGSTSVAAKYSQYKNSGALSSTPTAASYASGKDTLY